MASVKRDYLTFNAHQKPNVGDTKMSALGIDHMGWLICDGRLVNVSDFLFLFNVIGYSFGGTGGQFQLPNAAGRVPGAIGAGSGLTSRALGDKVGTETHTLTIAEMPAHNHGTDATDVIVGNNLTGAAGSHTHTINDPGHSHTQTTINDDFNNTGGNYGGNYARPSYPPSDSAGTITWTNTINSATTGITVNAVGNHQHSIATQGGGQAHNNMQPTLFMGNMFIYSGKTNYGNYPYTNGYYKSPPTRNLDQNIL